MSVLSSLNLEPQAMFQMRLFYAALRAMQLGVRVDLEKRASIARELDATLAECDQFISSVLGHPLNVKSHPQMVGLFYGDLGQKPVMSRPKKGQPAHLSCDDESLQIVANREPLLRPLIYKILHRRGISTLKSNFLDARVSDDGRMRTSINICGTETYRTAQSEDAFGSGLNMTTIPDENTKASVKAERRGERIPNVKSIFVPDEGHTFFNLDLDRADLHIVVWEADDKEMKQILREGVDIHTENAKILGCDRELAKSFIHGTNYGGSGRTMAIVCGIPVQTADSYQSRWFQAHPGIRLWHQRVEKQLRATREVHNAFGFRRHYFDRVDGLLPEALAWIPQSTVACTINQAWINLVECAPDIEVLLQVHDSLAGQFHSDLAEACLDDLQRLSRIRIPYPDELVIPTSIKTSVKSWGDCEAL